MEKCRARIRQARRVALKVGSQVLLDKNGRVDPAVFSRIALAAAGLIGQGKELVIVSSGAIASGRAALSREKGLLTLPEKQAVASLGQPILMRNWGRAFSEHQILVGQALLTHDDFSQRQRYLHSRNTLEQMLKLKILPIINENDAVAVEEIKFGDNDLLAALVAVMLKADLLVILSVAPGLCDLDPLIHPEAKVIPIVRELSRNLYECAGSGKSETGSGGMESKLRAAEIAGAAGILTFIGSGKEPGVLEKLMDGKILGTLILPDKQKLSGLKHWLLFAGKAKGELRIDQGAVKALKEQKKSLLPSGVLEVKGKFLAGELVRVVDEQGKELAKGLVNYGASDLKRIKGMRTDRIQEILGSKDYDEVIHRDNLAVSGRDKV